MAISLSDGLTNSAKGGERRTAKAFSRPESSRGLLPAGGNDISQPSAIDMTEEPQFRATVLKTSKNFFKFAE